MYSRTDIDEKAFIKLQADPVEKHMSFLRMTIEERGMVIFVANEAGDAIGMVAIENGLPVMKPIDSQYQVEPY